MPSPSAIPHNPASHLPGTGWNMFPFSLWRSVWTHDLLWPMEDEQKCPTLATSGWCFENQCAIDHISLSWYQRPAVLDVMSILYQDDHEQQSQIGARKKVKPLVFWARRCEVVGYCFLAWYNGRDFILIWRIRGSGLSIVTQRIPGTRLYMREHFDSFQGREQRWLESWTYPSWCLWEVSPCSLQQVFTSTEPGELFSAQSKSVAVWGGEGRGWGSGNCALRRIGYSQTQLHNRWNYMEPLSLCPLCRSPSQGSYTSCLRNLFPSLVNFTPGKTVKLIHIRCAWAMRPETEATMLQSITGGKSWPIHSSIQ